jgi:hypothetical protein
MQKKNIYILILILIVLLIGGAILYSYLKKSEKSSLSQDHLSQEQLGEIIEKKDLAACDKISNKEDAATCRNAIAQTLAKEKLDTSFCGKLDNEKNQATCVKQVLYDKAEKEGVQVCQQAGTEQEKRDCEKEYYLTMAIQKNDVTQCENLNNEQDINECQKDFSEWQKSKYFKNKAP